MIIIKSDAEIEMMKVEEFKRRGAFEIYHDEIEWDFLKYYYLNTWFIIFKRFSYVPDIYSEMKQAIIEVFPKFYDEYSRANYIRCPVKWKSYFLYCFLLFNVAWFKLFYKVCSAPLMRQGLDKTTRIIEITIKQNKDDFCIPECWFPNFWNHDFGTQEYSYDNPYMYKMNKREEQLMRMLILDHNFTVDELERIKRGYLGCDKL